MGSVVPISEIPPFTEEDFYTKKPYAWLGSFSDDKFQQNLLRAKLQKFAQDLGVKGFLNLWKSYLEQEAKEKNVKEDNVTAFSGLDLELFCGKYLCNDFGVVGIDRFGCEFVVCPHPIAPVERLVNIDTGEERIKIAYKNSRRWREITVEKAVIASSSSILQLAKQGVVVNSENAKALSTYLMTIEQDNYEDIPEQRSVGRLGWVGDNEFSPYVEGLIFDGEDNFSHIFNAVTQEGSYDEWKDIMCKVRAEKTDARLFLAASFASVLVKPCGMLPFFLHGWGTTEIGKTVALMVAASVWGNPDPGEYITTFNSTLVGQEMTATFLNSLPMCIDELQIQSSQGVKDFDKIIYQLTEGVGKTRGAKTGGLQKVGTWKNCFISTGERPITNSNSNGGAVNRILELECVNKIYSDLVGLCNVIRKNYGFAGKEFVEALQKDGMIDYTKNIQKRFYEELLENESTEKQAMAASLLLTADTLITNLIFKDSNFLTVKDLTRIMTKKSDVDANRRCLDFIYDMVTVYANKFDTNSFGEYTGEIWGKIEQKPESASPDRIYIVKSVFDREIANAGFDAQSFLSWAKRNDLIEFEEGKNTKKARINSNISRCVVVKCTNMTESV